MPGFMNAPGTSWLNYQQGDQQLGRAGQPIRVYDAILVSGSTASTVKLINGTSNTGTTLQFIQIDGIINKSSVLPLSSSNGVLFPAGCFVDMDNNTQSFMVTWNPEV